MVCARKKGGSREGEANDIFIVCGEFLLVDDGMAFSIIVIRGRRNNLCGIGSGICVIVRVDST